MEVVGLISVTVVIVTLVIMFWRPEIAAAAQLLGLPFFGFAFQAAGFEFGVIYAMFAITLIAGIVYSIREGIDLMPCTAIEYLIFAMFGYLAFTLVFTSAPEYGTEKVLLCAGIAAPALWFGRIVGESKNGVGRLLQVLGLYGMATIWLLAYVFFATHRGGARFTAGFNPLAIGYTTAAAVVACFYIALEKQNPLLRVGAVISIAAGLVVIVATGSRGPMVALLVGVGLALFRRRGSFKAAAILIVVVSLGLFAILKYSPESGQNRILNRNKFAKLSAMGRLELLELGFEHFQANPILGGGSGSFARFAFRTDERMYAHNVPLEVAGECGLIGLSLFLIALAKAGHEIKLLRRGSQLATQNIERVIEFMFFVGLLNSLFSFDMPQQKILFLSLGVLAGLSRQRMKSQNLMMNRSRMQPMMHLQQT